MRETKRTLLSWLGFTALLLATATALGNDGFPGRDKFPEVPVIEVAELHQRLGEVTVVDVRSEFEYETLHITGALNIPLANKDFADRMRELRAQDARPIVVYCNGKTCFKSYKAVVKCTVEKIPDVVAYDAGIMDWAKAYADEAELLGKTLGDPAKLIATDDFKARLIDAPSFADRVGQADTITLDMRDRFQREAVSLFVGYEYRVYMDDRKRLDKYIAKAKKDNKTLLVYDAVGKQVRWLQYYLEAEGLSKYYFMKGGAKAFYDQVVMQ